MAPCTNLSRVPKRRDDIGTWLKNSLQYGAEPVTLFTLDVDGTNHIVVRSVENRNDDFGRVEGDKVPQISRHITGIDGPPLRDGSRQLLGNWKDRVGRRARPAPYDVGN